MSKQTVRTLFAGIVDAMKRELGDRATVHQNLNDCIATILYRQPEPPHEVAGFRLEITSLDDDDPFTR